MKKTKNYITADKGRILTNGKGYTKKVMLAADFRKYAWIEISDEDEKYQAYLKKQQEELEKQQEELEKQQEELEKQQEELEKQQEELEKQQENIEEKDAE